MDRDHYISEAERQLGDSTYYRLLDHDPTPEIAKKVSDAISEMPDKGHITRITETDCLFKQQILSLPQNTKSQQPGPSHSFCKWPSHGKDIRICWFAPAVLLKRHNRFPEEARCPGHISTRLPPCFHGCHFPLYQYSSSRWHPGMLGSLEERKIKDPPTQTSDPNTQMQQFWVQQETLSPGQRHCYGYKMALVYANIFMGRLEGQLLSSVALRPFSWLRLTWSGRTAARFWQLSLTRPTTSTRAKSSRLKFEPNSTCFWTPNQVLWAIRYLLIYIQNQKIHTSISYPQIATRNTSAKMFLTALHFASDVSAPIRAHLNKEQDNWLNTSANGVIKNRKFHLSLREHGNRREKTYFLIGLNLSRAFSPSCWCITQPYQKWGI